MQNTPSQGVEPELKKTEKVNGGKRPGSGRKAFVNKLTDKEKKELAKISEAKYWVERAEEVAAPFIFELVDNPDATFDSRLRAAQEILNRALGKPLERNRLVDKDDNDRDFGVLMYPEKRNV